MIHSWLLRAQFSIFLLTIFFFLSHSTTFSNSFNAISFLAGLCFFFSFFFGTYCEPFALSFWVCLVLSFWVFVFVKLWWAWRKWCCLITSLLYCCFCLLKVSALWLIAGFCFNSCDLFGFWCVGLWLSLCMLGNIQKACFLWLKKRLFFLFLFVLGNCFLEELISIGMCWKMFQEVSFIWSYLKLNSTHLHFWIIV